eukprot:CAMPEP_0118911928 /NCGR_PEP_ID=MMETSP1166-20130328/13409_1 /TAXON_ID=1104430 /ORGANISM="Chrysoreinhardia sp, Strain CCMP3193" /LENGTH=56 /DNA_ID=CAMNT_0006851441 /DNA_START=68 /DNA_END=234 /DNA_ORIENTATION=+
MFGRWASREEEDDQQQQRGTSRAVSQDTTFVVSREVEDVRQRVSRALSRGAVLEAR